MSEDQQRDIFDRLGCIDKNLVAVDERMKTICSKVDRSLLLMDGNGSPEKGLLSRVAKLEWAEGIRGKVFWLVLSSVIAFVLFLLKETV